MCVCIYTCLFLFIYIYIYIHTHTRTRTRTHKYSRLVTGIVPNVKFRQFCYGCQIKGYEIGHVARMVG